MILTFCVCVFSFLFFSQARARAALGVCTRTLTGSRIYTDCSLSGKPSTFVDYSDSKCSVPSTSLPSISPVASRTCTGGSCSQGYKFFCNAVQPVPPAPSDCITSPDVNGDGRVDILDMLIVLNLWGSCGSNLACNKADLNCDGRIDINEVTAIIINWS